MERKEKYSFTDFQYWSLQALVPVLIACYAISLSSFWWVFIYLVIFFGHFLVLEYRFFCTRCPQYLKDSKLVKCIFIWGMPKFYQKRPGPYSGLDLLITLLSFAIAVLLPVYWLMKSWLLLVIYFAVWLNFFLTVRRDECNRCIHLACPLSSSCAGVGLSEK